MIRTLLLLLFACSFGVSYAQYEKKLDFMGHPIDPSEQCEIMDYYHYSCGSFEAKWSFVPAKILRKSAFDLTEDISKSSSKFKRTVIPCEIMGNDAEAYSISYTNGDKEKLNHIVAYGTVQNKGVIIELISEDKLKSNDQVPAELSKIFQFN